MIRTELSSKSVAACACLLGASALLLPGNASSAPNAAGGQTSAVTELTVVDDNNSLGPKLEEATVLLREFENKHHCSIVLVISSDGSTDDVAEHVGEPEPRVVVDSVSKEVRSGPVAGCEEIALLHDALNTHVKYDPGADEFASDVINGLKLAIQLEFPSDDALTAQDDEPTTFDRLSALWPFAAFALALAGLYLWNRIGRRP